MTEQIKDSMETCRIIIHATEEELSNQLRYNDAKEIEVALNDMLKAFRSLQIWKEVLQELEHMRDIIWQDTNNDARIVRANAWDKIEILNKTIDIINQKLAEIEKVR